MTGSRRRVWALARALLVAAGVLVALRAALRLLELAGSTEDDVLSPYIAPTYWLDYGQGFLRRGFTGEALTWLAGDVPTIGAARAWSTTLTVLSAASILVLARVLSRRVIGGRWERAAIAAAVLASPVLLSVPVKDFGRPDAFGVVAVVIIAVVPWRRVPWAVALGAMALLCALATAAEEFLLLVTGPVALLQAARLLAAADRRPVWAGVALIPATALAAASVLVTPSGSTLRSAVDEATAAGAPPADPLIADGVTVLPRNHSVAALSTGLAQSARNYYAQLSPSAVVGLTLLWGLAFLVTVVLVWQLLGGSLRDRAFLATAAGGAGLAVALSVPAIDYRRWWALSAVAVLGAFAVVAPSRAARTGPAVAVPAVLVAVSGLLLQMFEVHPIGLSWGELPLL